MMKNNFLRKFCLSAALVFAVSGLNASQSLEYLVPTPQECSAGEMVKYTGNTYCVVDNFGIGGDTLLWLQEDLAQSLKWKPAAGADTRIVLEKCKAGQHVEAYELEVASGKIRIAAAESAGILRGIGRFLYMADICARHDDASSVSLPGVRMKDWPDYSFRGVHFQIGGRYGRNTSEYCRRLLNVMGKLGYNYAALELGGRFPCKKHTEIVRDPAWPMEEVEKLLAYARARGINPIPATNSIGHTATSPKIFMLEGRKFNHSKQAWQPDKEAAMDLSHPDFYSVWFDYLDELLAAFAPTEYLMIGNDEFQDAVELLEGKTGMKLEDFHSTFLNKTNEYAKKKGVKLVIWHDMLLPKYDGREAANGTFGTVAKMDKDIIVNYWDYEYLPEYAGLKKLATSGIREMWVTTHCSVKGSKALIEQSRRLGVTKAMTSIWGYRPHYLGFGANAEYLWNSKDPRKLTNTFFENLNDRLFYAPRSKGPIPENMSPEWMTPSGKPGVSYSLPDFSAKLAKAFPGGVLDCYGVTARLKQPFVFGADGSTPPPRISWPFPVKKLVSDKAFFSISSSWEYTVPDFHLNVPRMGSGIYIYMPDFGKSTKTNVWGDELALGEDGKILFISPKPEMHMGISIGNTDIPQDGMVFSMRGVYDRMLPMRHGSLSRVVGLPGGKVVLRSIPAQMPEAQTVTQKLERGSSRMVLLFTAAFPVERGKRLANIRLTLADGTKTSNAVEALSFFSTSFQYQNARLFMAHKPEPSPDGLLPVLGLEYISPAAGKDVNSISVEVTPYGILSGFAILGGLY